MPNEMAYDVKAKQKVIIQNPKTIKKRTKNGRIVIMVTGTSPLTGIRVFRIIANQKA